MAAIWRKRGDGWASPILVMMHDRKARAVARLLPAMHVHLNRLFLLCFFCSTAALANVDLDDLRGLITSGKYQQALESAEAEINAGDRDTALRFYYAFAAAQLGLTDKAITEFQQLARELPKSPEPHNNLAVLYAQKGELDKARAALEEALATHPSYATAQRNLGEIYSAMATQAYNRALARDEKRPAPAPRLSLLDSMQMPLVAQLASPPPREALAPAVTVSPKPAPKAEPPPTAEAARSPVVAPAQKAALAAAAEPAKARVSTPAVPMGPAVSGNKLAAPEAATVAQAPASAPPKPAAPPAPITPAAAPSTPAPALAAPTAKPTPIAKAKTEPALAAAAPVASGLEQQARAVTEAVQGWAKAWSAQNADAYLAAYASNFQPEGGVARSNWAKVRRDRVTRPKRVEVKLTDMQIKLLTDTTAQARFTQLYSSDAMHDAVAKRLDLVREGAGWKILREQIDQR